MRTFDCEILILGAGPAGLSAALAAARCGKAVIVLDDNPRPGGQIWRDGPQVSLPRRARQLRQAVAEQSSIMLLNGARLIARPMPHSVVFETADGCGEIRWQRLILCCGARELSLPFPGWTLPGVTGAGGLQAQIKHGLSLRGERVVIAGSGPLLLAVASTVKRAGGSVVAIIEQAPLSALARFAAGLWRWPEKLRQFGELFPAHYHPASQVIHAQGDSHLQSVTVRYRGKSREIACDRLAIGYGLVPNSEAGALFGCKSENLSIWVDAEQRTSVQDIYAAGECTGFGGSELALAEGEIAGYCAAGQPEKAENAITARVRWQRFAEALHVTFALPDSLKEVATADTLLCRCEDIRCGEVQNAESWQAAKLASRCGMGACQGKTCATSARWLYGWPLPQPREPLSPARIDTLIHLAKPEG
ncbi:NAD(P)/FAD-dependent oxidoreductase [Citrobacter rodentium]|uniref:Exported protein n=2 Tax=Citrobacter rodentium TaxID=67825 RepID=D2TUL5_CITRI|nr:FAD/NAD(P)-binding oxidoreductase [Citrobacter rodentium]KIQ49034.1 pyridine nucleotide-disulfide oxidoreductase [Citrobacter rodentium]QBY29037.1 FAD-binding protein [Citrobacter rodentium]UHO29106.1 NAD(P)/FAD-dependent oxidoreductase [Citrobacter rodentium NBRC 105723 = DSM 16636]CBG89284.1 putative exported protein [Citrobacter rodentium ICC168]HAT8014882.1 FAD/NAD(P)-binding oxidoreductase [Citrobacter rodentium NBRC 105723 = DSM 16636]